MSTLFIVMVVVVNIVLIGSTFAMCEIDREDREFWLWLALGGVSLVNMFALVLWNI